MFDKKILLVFGVICTFLITWFLYDKKSDKNLVGHQPDSQELAEDASKLALPDLRPVKEGQVGASTSDIRLDEVKKAVILITNVMSAAKSENSFTEDSLRWKLEQLTLLSGKELVAVAKSANLDFENDFDVGVVIGNIMGERFNEIASPADLEDLFRTIETADDKASGQLLRILICVTDKKFSQSVINILASVTPTTNQDAAENLGSVAATLDSPAVTDALLRAYTGGNEMQKIAASYGMRNITSEDAIPLLKEMIFNEGGQVRKGTDIQAAVFCLGNIPSEESVRILEQLSKNEDEEISQGARVAFASLITYNPGLDPKRPREEE